MGGGGRLRNGEGVNGTKSKEIRRTWGLQGAESLAEGPFPPNLPGVLNFPQHSD